MNNISEMKKLIAKLNEASMKYYNGGNSTMSDKEFDSELDRLRRMERESGIVLSNSPTQNVGAPVLNELKKITMEDKPMLSLDKCHSAEEIKQFSKGQTMVASIKCDGLSVRLIYEGGQLVSANTRGNGTVGQDISEHAKHFTNVPLSIPAEQRVIVDGEAIIFQKDFEKINQNKEFKNPRNLAAGTLASLDVSLCDARKLSFIAWDLIEGKNELYYSDKMNWLSKLGFTTVPTVTTETQSVDTFDKINQQLLEVSNKLGIPCDGIVYKYNNPNYNTTRTAKFFNNAIAYKFSDETYNSTLKSIDYDVSRNGVLTPVAVFEPVETDGSVVERATLHNLTIMKTLLHGTGKVGQPITFVKANMIIPQIVGSEDIEGAEIALPDKCPVCGGEVELKTSATGVESLYCTNPNCSRKLTQVIDHFCSKKGIDIKGLSKATIEKLVEWGWVNSIEDIFHLEQYKAEWVNKSGFGAASVNKILKSIEDSKETDLESFISGLGIPLVGRTVAALIIKELNLKNWSDFKNLLYPTNDSLSSIKGIGKEMINSLLTFDFYEANKLESIIHIKSNENLIEKEGNGSGANGLTFVITGKSSYGTRDEVKKMIEKAGGKVMSAVSGKTNYLVANAPEDSSKYRNAVAKGIPIINDAELGKILGI